MPEVVAGAVAAADVAAALATETDLGLRPPIVAARAAGGHSWWTYVCEDAAGHRVVIRMAPPGGTMSPYDPTTEERAVNAASGAVPTAPPLAVVVRSSVGRPYAVHAFAPGTVHRLGDVAAADRAAHRRSFAQTLGRLHAHGNPALLDPVAAGGSTTEALRRDLEATVATFVRSAPCRHPGFTIGVRWLLTHLPTDSSPPVLCHGDFRFHNLAWTDEGTVAAVLDWERAWVGDPMVDVAFTRRFSGWCAVDGDVVPAYEAAAGRRVDEDRVTYGDRYEWVRSTTSATRAWQALAAGRDDAPSLFAIGEAGWAGAWAMVELLTDGPLLPVPDGAAPEYQPALTPHRRDELRRLAAAAGDDRLEAHLATDDADDATALVRSVTALRRTRSPADLAGDLGRALDDPRPAEAWSKAYRLLALAATTAGPELLPVLRALGRRFTDRWTLLASATTAGRWS